MTKSLFEDLTSVFYPEISLPPLWQVIYHEAMRGHHILFDKEKVSYLEETLQKIIPSLTFEVPHNTVVETAITVMRLNSLSEMREYLNKLPDDFYHFFYRTYLYLLENMRFYVKSQLN